MTFDIFFDMIYRLTLILAPAAIASLALNRLVTSVSWRRAIYGLMMLATSSLAVSTFSDVILGQPTGYFIAIGCLMSPIAWGLMIWVACPPESHTYYGMAGWRNSFKEAAPQTSQDSDPVPVPVFRTVQPIHPPKWGHQISLEFVPSAEDRR